MSSIPATRLLIDEPPLMVLPQLAARIGLNEAIILQQVHYWTRDNRNVIEGRSWTYNTVSDWQKQFPFWSQATIRRTIDSLVEKGLLIKKKLADNKMDATLWYSINLEKLVGQVEQIDVRKMSKSATQDAQMSSAQNEQIPNRTEISSETTTAAPAAAVDLLGASVNHRSRSSSADLQCPVDEIVAAYHELMPDNPRVKAVHTARRKAIAARWREASKLDCKPFGYSTVEDGLRAWRSFFAVCAQSAFLTGKAKPKPGCKRFRADIDFLTSPSGFTRCLEGKYQQDVEEQPDGSWSATREGIESKAEELGIVPKVGESYSSLRDRCEAELRQLCQARSSRASTGGGYERARYRSESNREGASR